MNRREFVKSGLTLLAGTSILALVPGCLGNFGEQDSSFINDNLEKPDISIGFLPITCAAPIIMADSMGFYKKYGLNVTIKKFGGFAEVRDSLITNELDVAHILSPMAISMSLGVGSAQVPTRLAAIENINGSAITLSVEHKDTVKEIKDLKGMRIGIPFDYSIHNLLIRYYLAEGGLDPDKDVELRLTRPADMIANLVSRNLDGFIVAEPFNQRAVHEGYGFIYKLTKDIWTDHPCCALGVKQEFIDKYPKTYQSLLRAIVDAINYSSNSDHRTEIAQALAHRQYLNQPEEVVKQVLTGHFPDGLGNMVQDPKRIDFDPFPWKSSVAWMLTQMIKWGYVDQEQAKHLDIKQVADQICLTNDIRGVQKELGFSAPTDDYRVESIMGKAFDIQNVDEWIHSV